MDAAKTCDRVSVRLGGKRQRHRKIVTTHLTYFHRNCTSALIPRTTSTEDDLCLMIVYPAEPSARRNGPGGIPTMVDEKRGQAALFDALTTKGTAFSAAERRKKGLLGLLPTAVKTLDQQAAHCWHEFSTRRRD